MSLKHMKFKKLRKELQYWLSESEYVSEVLKEWHHSFEDYQREYCEEHDINLEELNANNTEKVDTIMTNAVGPAKPAVDFKAVKQDKQIKNLYKQLARKLHPDVGGDEEEFKKITTALSENNFEKLLDMCDEHAILIEIDDELVKLIKKQIKDTKKKINKDKSTYSWSLYNCEDNKACKEKVMKNFLKHLFNYKGKNV